VAVSLKIFFKTKHLKVSYRLVLIINVLLRNVWLRFRVSGCAPFGERNLFTTLREEIFADERVKMGKFRGI